ncbi:hypothetical protein ACFUN8_29615 [Streptomyces sp. NPDC057307]|uniref:hypothetical protein n=1 Tax=Streptomyces sp. NPDC057307 TaxID=3346096 RepID=UPI00362902A6
MNSALEPLSARPATAGRPAMCVVLLVLCTLLGMSLDPCASAARGAEPRPAVSTVPEPAGEGHHDTTAMAAQSASARAGRGAAGPSAGKRERAARPPYGGAVAPSGNTPAAPPATRRVVLRC